MRAITRKCALSAAAVALLLCAAPFLPRGVLPRSIAPVALADGANLLVNGSFEEAEGDLPFGWVTDQWDNEIGFTQYALEPAGGADGGAVARIENREVNDARFGQEVAVEKGALYRLSGDIKVEEGTGTWGATLSFKDTFTYTEPLLDTAGEWVHVEVYARAGDNQSITTVYARLGGYGSTCTGRAWFDNVVLEKVDGLPEGVTAKTMATNTPAKSGDGAETEKEYLPLIIIVAFLFGGLMLYFFKRIRGTEEAPEGKRRKDWQMLGFVGGVALLVRLALGVLVRGYPNDIDCWLGWSGQAVSGLFTMYTNGGFNDYPPGYMYVLWLVGQINRALPSPTLQVLVCKLPAIICDLATGYILYDMALKRLNPREALTLALLYVFNPLVIVDSAAWGQIDSVLALIVVGCFWQVHRNNLWKAAAFYGIGLLVKPQMLLFGPVMLGALIVVGRNAGGVKAGALIWLKTIGAGLAAFILPALPFWIATGDPMWLPNQYLNTLGGYTNASLNACNLLALFGGNWAEDTQKLLYVPYWVWGYVGMVLVSLFTMFMMIFRERTNRRIFFYAAFLITGLFMLGLRMHERYMFPVLALLLVYYIQERDRRALYLFGMFSMTQFLNVAMVLANKHMSSDVLRFGDFLAIADPEGQGLWVFLISLIALAAFIYMVYTSFRLNRPLTGGGVASPEEAAHNRLERMKNDLNAPPALSRIPMTKKDWGLMGGLTLAYAVLSLVYLGTTNVPKNMWHAAHTGDYAVVDLGQTWAVSEIWHYDSLTKGNLQVSVSDDGVEWTDSVLLKHRATESGEHDDLGIYKWTIDTVDAEARYFRFTVTTPPVRMLEVVFKDALGQVIPPAGISDSGGDSSAQAASLIDEQGATPERPSFFNGMYFDEIYHARTGWEFTQGLDAYENTHPPLGKDLISLGILIFGMNPFGWRFMGTVIGILMVPAMYLFGMAFFRKTRYAFLTAFLFTFDFMHFVQTRIATIDSYAVLFIILTFTCMFLYLRSNFNTQKLWHTLPPLAFSGVAFGLASASKWIGFYAGAGLCLLFFYSLYRRSREYQAVKYGEVEMEEDARAALVKAFPRKVVLTLLWCALFFIVIPGVIYFASYMPFNNGKGDWNDFQYAWNNQASMFNYHSNLVDNHFFKSPWYQWPFMIKPMWFYKADYLPQGWMGSIATFGNPAVWWAGTAAMGWLVLRVYRNRRFSLPDVFLIAGFLTEFLPWVLVPRTMFIYHYFASVPFFVIAIVLYIHDWEGEDALRRRKTRLYLAVVLALFILFYPVLSGMPIPSWYGAILKWMPTWYFTY